MMGGKSLQETGVYFTILYFRTDSVGDWYCTKNRNRSFLTNSTSIFLVNDSSRCFLYTSRCAVCPCQGPARRGWKNATTTLNDNGWVWCWNDASLTLKFTYYNDDQVFTDYSSKMLEKKRAELFFFNSVFNSIIKMSMVYNQSDTQSKNIKDQILL